MSSIQVIASSCSREESREWREGGAREGWREGEVAAKNWEMTRRLEWATAAWRGRAAVGGWGRLGEQWGDMTACKK